MKESALGPIFENNNQYLLSSVSLGGMANIPLYELNLDEVCLVGNKPLSKINQFEINHLTLR